MSLLIWQPERQIQADTNIKTKFLLKAWIPIKNSKSFPNDPNVDVGTLGQVYIDLYISPIE